MKNLIFTFNEKNYEKNGFEVVDNFSEEILLSVNEIEEQININIFISKEDFDLQKIFWNSLKYYYLVNENIDTNNLLISKSFVKNNKEWLFND